MGQRGDFFQIDHSRWSRVCELGVNAAIAYLVLARGTGADNSTTSWSANAIENHTRISRNRAGEAIKLLAVRNHIKKVEKTTPTRPQYKITLKADPDWVFLPNALIDGATTETPPIERLRRRGSIEALRMLIDAYHMQDLANDDGLDWRMISRKWERKQITARGLWTIRGYSDTNMKSGTWECPLAKQWNSQEDGASEQFWSTFNILCGTGLMEYVPYLVEGGHRDAELICPLAEHGTEAESRLYEAATNAAMIMLEDSPGWIDRERENHDIVIPVSNEFPNATVVGVYRLRYRAKTSLTAAWWSKQQEWQDYAQRYVDLSAPVQSQEKWG